MAAIAFIILGNLLQENPDWGNGVVAAGDVFVFFGWIALVIYLAAIIVSVVSD